MLIFNAWSEGTTDKLKSHNELKYITNKFPTEIIIFNYLYPTKWIKYLNFAATGEPPLCMSSSVVFAVRDALASARKNASGKDDWFQISEFLKTIVSLLH